MPHMTKSKSVTESGAASVKKPGDNQHENTGDESLRGTSSEIIYCYLNVEYFQN